MAITIKGRDYVSWSFNIERLEQWITTIEKLTSNVDFAIEQRNDWLTLSALQWELKAAHDLWEKQTQEEQKVSDAPECQDLQEYMADFATSVLSTQGVSK